MRLTHFSLLLVLLTLIPSQSPITNYTLPSTLHVSPSTKPFRLPFLTSPGPSTWYMVQAYGNTAGAYFQRRDTYRFGQGMHFGIDFAAPCGTEIVAIGSGVVSEVDQLSHGALPHNLLIDHPNGYTSFYGHLLRRAELYPGQRVEAGQVIALTGDPDETCHSRPHLHLEIRNHSHTEAYNPVNFIDADWDALALAGPLGRGFERDLDNPRQWQFLDDQPDVIFSGPRLNDYANSWPPEW